MDDRGYQVLKWTAIVLALCWAAWSLHSGWLRDTDAVQMKLEAAHRIFADAEYDKALRAFGDVLTLEPGNEQALRGIARSQMQLGRHAEALESFDRAIDADPQFGAAHANRAILLDRIGRHEDALKGYDRALALDPSLDEGPGWFTRFLRNQAEPQASIGQRAEYLRKQLALPPSKRVLRLPEQDERQRAYDH